MRHLVDHQSGNVFKSLRRMSDLTATVQGHELRFP